MKRYLAALGVIAVLASVSAFADDPATPVTPSNSTTPATAATPATPAVPAEHSMVSASDVKWVDAPPSMPKGAKFAVLSGDPAAPGPFTIRIKAPAGYKVPPHFHPETENVTVISGEMYMELGDKFDDSKVHTMGAGSFSVMPQGVHHFAGTKKGAVLQIHANGPWGITYVNPTDDPRNANQAGK